MFDPQLKLLARSLLEFPSALSQAEYGKILAALVTHLAGTPSRYFWLLAAHDRDCHLLKYLTPHYVERTGDFLVDARHLYSKIEETIHYLSQLGTDKNSSVSLKSTVSYALCQLGITGDRVVAAPFQALGDPESNIRWEAAVAALGRKEITDDRVLDALLYALGDKDSNVRQVGTAALVQMGKTDDRVVEALFQAVLDSNSHVRKAAAVSLGQLGVKDVRVVDILFQALGDKDGNLRWEAAAVLGQLAETDVRVAEALLQALRDPESNIRWEAAAALGQLEKTDDRVVEALLQDLGDRESNIRWEAAIALGQMGKTNDRVVEALLRALGDKREFVLVAGTAFGQLEETNDQVVDTIFQTLRDKDSNVRRAAAAALGQLEKTDNRVVEALLWALGDKSEYVRASAAAALLRIFFYSQQALSYLSTRVPKERWPQRLQIHSVSDPEGETIVRYIIETAASNDPQPVFETSHAILTIIQVLLDDNSIDSIYYSLLFFSIRKLRLSIALELLPLLSHPDTDERTKQVIFQLLLRVELI